MPFCNVSRVAIDVRFGAGGCSCTINGYESGSTTPCCTSTDDGAILKRITSRIEEFYCQGIDSIPLCHESGTIVLEEACG